MYTICYKYISQKFKFIDSGIYGFRNIPISFYLNDLTIKYDNKLILKFLEILINSTFPNNIDTANIKLYTCISSSTT